MGRYQETVTNFGASSSRVVMCLVVEIPVCFGSIT